MIGLTYFICPHCTHAPVNYGKGQLLIYFKNGEYIPLFVKVLSLDPSSKKNTYFINHLYFIPQVEGILLIITYPMRMKLHHLL